MYESTFVKTPSFWYGLNRPAAKRREHQPGGEGGEHQDREHPAREGARPFARGHDAESEVRRAVVIGRSAVYDRRRPATPDCPRHLN